MFQQLCTPQQQLITQLPKEEQQFAAQRAVTVARQVTDLHFGRVIFVAVEAQTHNARLDTASIAGTQTCVKANAQAVPRRCAASVSKSSASTMEEAIVVATELAL